jgi:hypothetical protein
MRRYILLSVILLAGAILLLQRGDLNAHGPHRLNRLAPTTECGFWGSSMAEGMSCR